MGHIYINIIKIKKYKNIDQTSKEVIYPHRITRVSTANVGKSSDGLIVI
jgi:hypothetical protein